MLRAVLERGLGEEIAARLAAAETLITSRLAMVEAARAFHRLRRAGEAPPARIADAERSVAALWRRCEIWELGREVCELAQTLAPRAELRTLDALHLATYVMARSELPELELLTADRRLEAAALEA